MVASLTLYYLIAYFLSLKTLQVASDMIKDLEVIFQKGSCFDYSVSFLRANQIRNSTVTIPSSVGVRLSDGAA